MERIIPPIRPQDQGPAVANFQEALLFIVGKRHLSPQGLSLTQWRQTISSEMAAQSFGEGTKRLFAGVLQALHLPTSDFVNEAIAERLNSLLEELGAFSGPGSSSEVFAVEGKVVSRSRAGVDKLRVEIVDKNVGDDVNLADTITDDGGGYRISFRIAELLERGKQKPDLQARVFAGEVFLGASEVRYDASNRETLNIFLTEESSKLLPSEHETLIGSLSAQFRGSLRDLKETDGRQDITYLANKTGWDARAVALAALADQFTRTADAGGAQIEAPFFYALFRVGVPANENAVYQITAKTAVDIWKQAISQGVISAKLETRIPQAAEQFQRLAVERSLNGPALAGVSSLKDMLKLSLGDDAARHKRFAELYAEHRNDPAKLWEAVRGSLGEAAEKRLRLDGQLAYLTLNNAPLMRKLHAAAGQTGLTDTVNLAEQGYYRAEKWRDLIGDDAIPPEITGDNAQRYAEVLAAKVRLSFPTTVVAQMVRSGETPVTPGLANKVHAFLTEHQGKFEIGMQPVQRYIARNRLQVPNEVSREVTRIQRVYQITPSASAMNALLKRGVDSALAVSRYDREQFVRTFKDDLGGEANARLTHTKAQQVHNIVLNLATSYLVARTAPQIGAHSQPKFGKTIPAPIVKAQEAVAAKQAGSVNGWLRGVWAGESADNAEDVISYATLEDLFGAMDYCACEHCRSWLSPAAYLVDLLQFLDHPDLAPEKNPLTIFLDRRPDIEHVPLTCENTNTPLPYIDIVNETLEYFVANVQKLTLNGYLGHDTGTAASEDLLASPQAFNDGVRDAAYSILRGERFPAPLPFHQPLENLRRYFGKFEVPLPLAMERLRKNNDLERGTNSYGWRDILMEEIGLSRAEYEILTTSNAAPNVLWRIYGFPSGTSDVDIINGNEPANIPMLSSVKTFARRVGITCEDIVAILKTRLVNPNSGLIPKLERLGVSFPAIKALKDAPGNTGDAAFDALLPTGAGAPDPAEYDDNIKAWLKNDDNYTRIMSLITLVNPTAGDDTCNLDNLEFRRAQPMANATDTSTRLGAVEFVRLLRFIRLWKKTGWTLEQTDAAICALLRADLAPFAASDVDTVAKLDVGFLTLLPRLGIVRRVMNELKLTPKRDLLSLLACWSEIGTHGDSALYRQMFLNPALLKQDPVFNDNGYGEFLTDSSQTLFATNSTKKAKLAGKITPGDVLSTSINGLVIPYTVVAGDTSITTLAGHIVSKVNATTTTDPITGQPLNDVILASNASGIISITMKNPKPDSVITLACSVSDGATETYAPLDHESALCAAFNLTASEFTLIADALKFDATTPLSLPNISAIYRRGWLARKLKLSVRELLLLIQLTGLDPFAAPDPTNPAILRLISLIQAFKDRSLKSAVALYLMWNQDLSGKSAPDPAQVIELARTLRGDFAAIDDQFAAEDAGGDVARTRMTLVYGQETTDRFFALLDDTLVLDVTYIHSAPMLEEAIKAIDANIAYDDFRHRLSHTGVLSNTTRNALKAIGGVSNDFKATVDALFDRGEEINGLFFTRYPELKEPYNTAVAMLLGDRHDVFLAAFQPELSRKRKRQQAVQRLSAAVAVDLAFTQAMLDPPAAPYPLCAAGDANRPALDDVIALETPGLSVQFFANDTATGALIPFAPIVANLDYAPAVGGVGNPLPPNPTPGAGISGIWRGRVEAPEMGFYNIVIEADPDASVKLEIDRQVRALTKNGNVRRNTDALELKAGTVYDIVLTVEKVKDVLSVKWETPKRSSEVIPARYLYPTTILAPFSSIYIRFLKAASLAAELKLTSNEMAYFATHADYRINEQGQIGSNGQGWLNALPNADNLLLTNPADAAIAQNLNAALLTPLRALLDFARIKAEISPNDESLWTALKDPTTTTQKKDSLLFSITRWNQTLLNDVLGQFGGNIAGLGRFDLFQRVYDAFALIQKMGISAKALIQATTNDPTADTVRDLQAALRARYDAASWRDVVRPINDEMRSLQRDALVAYILHQMGAVPKSQHIDTAEKLFEYFLMDVQMDPCMQTSRIRHALSSVQLFIERCFMNLETGVEPTIFEDKHRKQWEWMKRYRVWEANRKVFLWPENWVEPELRLDQSPFFKEALSELLQSDITEDRAATALLNYLSKLEEVAKLEPCGIHFVEAEPGKSNAIAHVVARTPGANRKCKYFYRRYDGLWTPWEQIKLDIEDNPVIPVVWKDRLFLFWLKILKQAPMDGQIPQNSLPAKKPGSEEEKSLAECTPNDLKADAQATAQSTRMEVQAILCWSEYYNGKWQPTKTSSVDDPAFVDRSAPDAFERSELSLWVVENEHYLRVLIIGDGAGASYFNLYNTHSLPEWGTLANYTHEVPRLLDTFDSTFTIKYSDSNGDLPPQPVLETTISDRTVQPQHRLHQIWEAPFFYEDRRHVFYVTTKKGFVPVQQSRWYYVTGDSATYAPIQSLIMRQYKLPGSSPHESGPTRLDPSSMKRFVTDDAYIKRGIPMTGAVGLDGVEIGPAGRVAHATESIKGE
jgi:ABC toxin N-terminal region/Neuraminidase-like domain